LTGSTDPLFQYDITAPGPSVGRYWTNLDATINNSGFEISLMGAVIRTADMQWNIGFNIALLKNEVKDLVGDYETGALHGQGITGATVQRLSSDYPLNVYYTRVYEGLDKATGVGIYKDNEANFYQGSPNPKQVYGITTDFTWKKFFAVVNMNGASGHFLYNNTYNSVIPIGNLGTRNIASSLIGGEVQENTSNAIKASSRYIEKGDYLKLANATIGYRLGSLGKAFSNVTATITGQNLFIISSFKGFDPEVNVDKNVQGVPSFGIEYCPYPSARTILFGLNFTL
jgi:TonB-dependent starch-binding outer membrane protein SusC